MKTDTSEALRHIVYSDLIFHLPPASHSQATRVIANLSLHRHLRNERVMPRLLLLRVTPDIAECRGVANLPGDEIERIFAARYGDRLKQIAGFYRHSQSGRYKLNLPARCALLGYRSRHGSFSGILCQPVDRLDSYFLLSSGKLGGERAIRLEHHDREFFEQFDEPTTAANKWSNAA